MKSIIVLKKNSAPSILSLGDQTIASNHPRIYVKSWCYQTICLDHFPKHWVFFWQDIKYFSSCILTYKHFICYGKFTKILNLIMFRLYHALVLSKKAKSPFQIPIDMKICANLWRYSKNLLFGWDFSDFFKTQRKAWRKLLLESAQTPRTTFWTNERYHKKI